MKRADALIPILTIKRDPPRRTQPLDAAGIHTPCVRVAARSIEWLDPARVAEQMIRCLRAEPVGDELGSS